MKVCLEFTFDGDTTYSETVKIGRRIQSIPIIATKYRLSVRDYRGYQEGSKFHVIFLNEKNVEVHTDLWKKSESEFRPIPEQAVFAKIERAKA